MWGGRTPGLAADMLWGGVQVLRLQDIPFNCVSAAGPLCAPGRQGSPVLGNAAVVQSRQPSCSGGSSSPCCQVRWQKVPPPIDAEHHHEATERPPVCHRAAGTRPRRCDCREPDMKTSRFNERGDVFVWAAGRSVTSVPAVGTARAVLGCKPVPASFCML